MVAKPMPSILTSTRSLILYPTANFQLKCGLQIFQEDFGPGSDHIYQIGPSMLILTSTFRFTPCVVWCPARQYFRTLAT